MTSSSDIEQVCQESRAIEEFSVQDGELSEPPVSILSLTWNVQSVRMAERAGSGNMPASWTAYERFDPDFIPALLDLLKEKRQDLFACALQETPKPGCYLQSHALPAALHAIGYVLVRRARFIGVGKTTFQNLRDNGDIVPRGLRLAVFARREWYDGRRVTVEDAAWPCPGLDRVTHGKGGVAICLHVPRIGRIAFLNCHLPFAVASVAGDNANRVYGGLQHQSHCLRALVKACYAKHRPHYLIVMGDMNFRMLNCSARMPNVNSVSGGNSSGNSSSDTCSSSVAGTNAVSSSAVASSSSSSSSSGGEQLADPVAMWRQLYLSRKSRASLYRSRDELRLAIDYCALPPFCEGVDNADGPAAFMPTGKMNHGRQPGDTQLRAYYFGNDNSQNPSWCDRVLYARCDHILSEAKYQAQSTSVAYLSKEKDERYVEGCGTIRCLAYDRFESGQTMTRSDHSAVVAHIAIDPIEYPYRHSTIEQDDQRVPQGDTALSADDITFSKQQKVVVDGRDSPSLVFYSEHQPDHQPEHQPSSSTNSDDTMPLVEAQYNDNTGTDCVLSSEDNCDMFDDRIGTGDDGLSAPSGSPLAANITALYDEPVVELSNDRREGGGNGGGGGPDSPRSSAVEQCVSEPTTTATSEPTETGSGSSNDAISSNGRDSECSNGGEHCSATSGTGAATDSPTNPPCTSACSSSAVACSSTADATATRQPNRQERRAKARQAAAEAAKQRWR